MEGGRHEEAGIPGPAQPGEKPCCPPLPKPEPSPRPALTPILRQTLSGLSYRKTPSTSQCETLPLGISPSPDCRWDLSLWLGAPRGGDRDNAIDWFGLEGASKDHVAEQYMWQCSRSGWEEVCVNLTTCISTPPMSSKHCLADSPFLPSEL